MKAIVYDNYGGPEVLHLQEVETPVPADDEVLIKIHAVSVNRSDWEGLIGKPLYARFGGLLRPSQHILGSDIAGRVEQVGKNNTEYKVGDEVFGEVPGYHRGFAEYVCMRGKTIARKPDGLTFEQAAAIPQAGVIAWQGIHEKGRVQASQKVLINGAGGGAGTFAVQLAKLYGAEITAVDNAGKLDFLRSLGADHVIDYRRKDFTRNGKQYDLILDVVAHRSVFAYQRALAPHGTYFFVGGSLGIVFQLLLFGAWIKNTRKKNLRLLAVQPNRNDLLSITQLCTAGKIIPIVDRIFPFRETPEALRYLGEGRARGKIVIRVAD